MPAVRSTRPPRASAGLPALIPLSHFSIDNMHVFGLSIADSVDEKPTIEEEGAPTADNSVGTASPPPATPSIGEERTRAPTADNSARAAVHAEWLRRDELGVVLAAKTASIADPEDKAKPWTFNFIVVHKVDPDDDIVDDITEIVAYAKTLPNTKQTDGEGCELDTPLYKALGVVLAARTAAAADPNDKVKHLDYIRGAADFIVAHGFDLDDEMADDIAEITAYMKNIRHQTDGKGCERDHNRQIAYKSSVILSTKGHQSVAQWRPLKAERTTCNRPFPVFKPASALPRTSRGRDTESDDERARAVPASAQRRQQLVLADPTNIAKKLHYKREAADYAEIHGYDDTIEDAEHIKAYVYQKMRDDFRLDELRYRAEPGLIDEYVAAAKKFAKDFGIPTRRTTAWTTRSLLLWDDDVRARRLGRDMRIVEVRNPFPLHDARRAAFDLQMREHMALYKGVPLDTLAESVEWPSIILRLHNRFHADPSSIECQRLFCIQELWSTQIKAMVDRAKMEATQ
ncbi:hypothetical protein K438DRAFT_1751375 [Mycena galopus ATCC 62051]|nr:hypothetical protein K438DRAFT_1751375 [Mycena galopus ATCC 62051]